ncbi:O-antigen/teichoic acid export membrane protein [Curtobacterium flaccumfaciens]|uniref:O-antigen/teichoic acid export membrane protein n=1 Tax=Curtobacterium flaccumfaciens TaxID=2035 RepID=A0A4R6DH23_9MICO|nr:oligosaccharide flippase family protein [Curtobacterium flaccumfaciens]TDN44026.1 O-antigen/teichoic acid export membrane protein [Curtobacterium flaccumfaciens]
MRTRTTAPDWADSRELGSAATRGVVASALTTWGRFSIQLVTMILVARMIGPSEFGAAATALVAVTAAELVRSGGITWLVSRAPALSAGAASTLHRLSIAVGALVALALLVAGALTPAAVLPAGVWTFPLLAVVFLAAGVGAVPTALLARNLRFRPIGTAEVAAAVVSCTVAISAAAAGLGGGAPLLQAASYAVVLCGIVVARTPWRPGVAAPLRTLRAELAFAGNATVSQGLEWLVRSFDRLVVAALFGTAAAGVYVQASQLVVLPVEQVNGPLRRVAVPALARLVEDPARYRTAFRAVLLLACSVLWPALAVLAVLAEPAVVSLFGTAWAESVPLFRAMVPLGMATVVTSVTTFVALSHGLAGRQTLWDCFVSRPLTVVAFFVGSAWGVTGVAVGASVVTVLLTVPGFLVIAARAGLAVRDLLSALVEPAVVAAVCTAVALLLTTATDLPQLGTLTVAGGSAIVVWAVLLLALPRTRTLVARARRRGVTLAGPAAG